MFFQGAMFLRILTFLMATTVTGGTKHELSLYSGFNLTGTKIDITSKLPNLNGNNSYLKAALKTAKSFCYTGCWDNYESDDYIGWAGRNGWTKGPICYNGLEPWNSVSSMRYVGPSDSVIPTLTVSENSGIGGWYRKKWIGGRELTASYGQNMSSLPFTPSYIVVTGEKPWTGYSNNDLSGTAICYIPLGEYVIHDFIHNNTDPPMLSFASGCDPNDSRIQKTVFIQVYHDPTRITPKAIKLQVGWISD